MADYVIVTPRSLSQAGHPYLQRLREEGYELCFPAPGRQPTEEELLGVVGGGVAYLAGVEKINANILEKAHKLKVISRNGVGVDNIDLKTAERLGIPVETASGANARGVAELAIALMLAVSRFVPQTHGTIKEGGWGRWMGREVQGKVLGLIGCGKIGRETARMALGLGMNVMAYDPNPDFKFDPGKGFAFTSMENLLKEADIVSLHCPPGNKPLLDRPALYSMKRNAILINTARAELIDAEAVHEALEKGRLFGLGTDVFSAEPPEPSPLIRHHRVVSTAHIGAFTEESVNRATVAAVDNIMKYLKKN